MILDKRTEFCDATALNTGGAGTYLIGSQIDLMATGLDVGAGEPIYLVINIDTAVDSAADNTTQDFILASDSTAAIATDGSATVHFRTGALAQTAIDAAGDIVAVIALPMGTYERYLGILHTTAVAAATAGKINAFLTKDVSRWKAYADAI
jgi:hypothetical protein